MKNNIILCILTLSCTLQAQRIAMPIRESMQTGRLAGLRPGKFFVRRNAGFESMEEVAAEPGIAGAWLVNLQGNNIAKLTAESFKGKKFEDVRLLNLSHNNIRTIGPYAFKNLKNLRVLFLGHNQIAYIAPMAFSGLKSVRIVTLNGNPNEDMLKAQLQAQLPRALITTQGVTKEFVNYSLGVAGIAAATGIAAGGIAYATRRKGGEPTEEEERRERATQTSQEGGEPGEREGLEEESSGQPKIKTQEEMQRSTGKEAREFYLHQMHHALVGLQEAGNQEEKDKAYSELNQAYEGLGKLIPTLPRDEQEEVRDRGWAMWTEGWGLYKTRPMPQPSPVSGEESPFK